MCRRVRLSRSLGDGVRLLPSDPPRRTSGCQRSRPQEVEVRPAVALSLEQLEFGDEAFHRSGAPLLHQPRPHRREVLLLARGKLLYDRRLATGGLLQPPVELLALEVPDHLGELLRQAPSVGQSPVGGAQPTQVLLLLGVQQLPPAHEQGRDVLGARGRAGYSARLRPRGEGDLLALLLRVAEAGEQPVDRVYAVAVAHLPDLLVEPLGAAATLVPPSQQVGQVGVEDAPPPPVARPWRWICALPVAVDGAVAGSDPLRYVLDARPHQVQPSDLLPPLDEALVALLCRPLDAAVGPSQADGQGRNVLVDGAGQPLPFFARSGRGPPQHGSLAQQELLQAQGEATEEVPAVGDLEGAGGARVDALPADVRAVSGDHLHARVPQKPPRYGLARV